MMVVRVLKLHVAILVPIGEQSTCTVGFLVARSSYWYQSQPPYSLHYCCWYLYSRSNKVAALYFVYEYRTIMYCTWLVPAGTIASSSFFSYYFLPVPAGTPGTESLVHDTHRRAQSSKQLNPREATLNREKPRGGGNLLVASVSSVL